MKQINTLLMFALLITTPATLLAQNKKISANNIRPTHVPAKTVALTFDDGPTPKVTKAVLKVLKKYNIPATFFIIGQKGEDRLDLLQQELDEGHIVANHSYSHKLVAHISRWNFKKTIQREFFKCHDLIKDYAGNGKYFYYRAPGASWKTRATKIINKSEIGQQYIGPVLWDIGGELHKNSQGHYTHAADWACWSHKLSVDQCLEGYLHRTKQQGGGIVLMHDVRSNTAKLLEKYIQALLDMGYTFVSLDDLELKH